MIDPYYSCLGIKADTRPPAPYQLLGVSPGERDAAVLEDAALAQAARVHGYQIRHPELATRLQEEIARALIALGKAGPVRPARPRQPTSGRCVLSVARLERVFRAGRVSAYVLRLEVEPAQGNGRSVRRVVRFRQSQPGGGHSDMSCSLGLADLPALLRVTQRARRYIEEQERES
jgi:hypothetical protein